MSARVLHRAEVTVLVYYWSETGTKAHYEAERQAREALADGSAFDLQIDAVECKSGERCDPVFGIPYGEPPTPGDERCVPEILAAMAAEAAP